MQHKLANPHVPLHAAALAVQELAPEMTLDDARTFAQKAAAWTALDKAIGEAKP